MLFLHNINAIWREHPVHFIQIQIKEGVKSVDAQLIYRTIS